MQWKEPQPRTVPDLPHTLRELHRYGITLDGRDTWRRRFFYKIAAFVLEPEQGRLVAKGTAWQNEAMTMGYLQGRESLAFFSNVSYLFESDPSATVGVLRAAVLAHRALQFHDDLVQGRLAPEIEGSQRLDQSQYPYFFGTSRVPGQDQDQMQYTADSGHFMVSCRGQFFRVDIPSDPTSVEDLYATFLTIETKAKPTSDSFGLLTSLPRTEWGHWRQRMMLDEQNSTAIKALDSALFLIAMDLDAAPADRTEAMANL
ncbi:MAG: choline/carnitine O-acyltransferase, partial [Proteobacteria bacterium]|nr:choline/carnitine O-acyltransferase [Pseudomonadota bacterium]